ncbi:unnamed protein product [Brachionus calyciflorus]|uniref:Uncharacterized protein n=1 Tax=Brachionus calyciflorus TaxID=104777 RepID=A0A814EHB7_9BILA|nr:unnamed protein product [Brachionus calyciflorus]
MVHILEATDTSFLSSLLFIVVFVLVLLVCFCLIFCICFCCINPCVKKIILYFKNRNLPNSYQAVHNHSITTSQSNSNESQIA